MESTSRGVRTGMGMDQRQLLPLFAGCLALLLGQRVCAAGNAAAEDAPAGVRLEAEAHVVSDSTIFDDPAASGGKAVTNPNAWQPLLEAALPPEGEAFTVWVRRRGGPLLLKRVEAGGGQRDLEAVPAGPPEWAWAHAGRYRRSEFGRALLVVRGPADHDGRAAPAVDLVVLSADPAAKPAARVAADPVRVRIDWGRTVATTSRHSFSLNTFAALDPATAAHPEYRRNMAYMAPGLVRYHNKDMLRDSAEDPDGWVDVANRRWDAAKVRRALDAFPAAEGDAGRGEPPGGKLAPVEVERLINIPDWPAWMDADRDGFLDPDQFDAFAAFCADLVRIVNAGQRRGVTCWEVTNELDGKYGIEFYADGGRGGLKDPARPDRFDEVIDIYNRCVAAMRAADPAIRCGGPSFTRPDLMRFVRRFVEGTRGRLDFLSYHIYASGDPAESDRNIYDKAPYFGARTEEIVALLAEQSPERTVAAHLNEYNIGWSWETGDPRMLNHKGAVFDALVMAAAVTRGAAVTCAWNEADGVHGKMSPGPGFKLRPAAHVFHLFNRHLVGEVVAATSGDQGRVVALAVKQAGGGGRRAVALVNRSDEAQPVRLEQGDWKPGGEVARHEVSEVGYVTSALRPDRESMELVLPPHSVTVLAGGG